MSIMQSLKQIKSLSSYISPASYPTVLAQVIQISFSLPFIALFYLALLMFHTALSTTILSSNFSQKKKKILSSNPITSVNELVPK